MPAVAALWAATAVCGQWSFTLDTTFRSEIMDQNVNAIHVLQDGKIFASGRIRFVGDLSDRVSVRLLTDGQRDLGFPQFPATTGGGKIVPWINDQFYVNAVVPRRMLSDGLIDPTFIALYDGPYFQSITSADYHVYPDGRLLVSGSHLLSDTARGFVGQYRLTWFSNQGYLDTTKTHRQANGVIWQFKEMLDGKFICSCSCSQYEGQAVDRVFRVHPDGGLDTTFHSGINWGNIYAYHPLPDGRVYVGGQFKRAAAPNDTLFIARLLPDGSMDPGFTPPYVSRGNLPGTQASTGISFIYPWQNGYVMITGQYRYVNGEPRNSICLLDSNGTVVDAFDVCGVGPFVYQGYTMASVDHVIQDTSSHIYIAGTYNGYDDGTINDTLQRFVSRLLVGELSTAVDREHDGLLPLSLYPNPADRTLMIAWGSNAATMSGAELSVANAQGQLLHTAPVMLAEEKYALDVSAYPAGLYHLHLVVDGQWVSGCKMIVE